MTLHRHAVVLFLNIFVFTVLLMLSLAMLRAAPEQGEVATLMMPRDQGVETYDPSISPDGRWVAYEHATNWGDGAVQSIRLFNTENRTFIQFDPRDPASGCGASNPVVSPDGRYVAFHSCWLNLGGPPNPPPAPCQSCYYLYLFDTQSVQYELVSQSTTGERPNGTAFRPSFSVDNRYIVFDSPASTLVLSDTNLKFDVFLRDRQARQTIRLSVGMENSEANGDSSHPVISDDGRHVVFQSSATNLVPNDTNNAGDIFLYTLATGVTERLSVASNGTEANGGSHTPSMTADGNKIAFLSTASNLVSNDTNSQRDVFLYSLYDDSLRRVSFSPPGLELPTEVTSGEITKSGNAVLYRFLNNGTSASMLHDLYRCQIDDYPEVEAINADASIFAYPDRVLAYRECEDPKYCRVTQVANTRGWDFLDVTTTPAAPFLPVLKDNANPPHPLLNHFLYLPATTSCNL